MKKLVISLLISASLIASTSITAFAATPYSVSCPSTCCYRTYGNLASYKTRNYVYLKDSSGKYKLGYYLLVSSLTQCSYVKADTTKPVVAETVSVSEVVEPAPIPEAVEPTPVPMLVEPVVVEPAIPISVPETVEPVITEHEVPISDLEEYTTATVVTVYHEPGDAQLHMINDKIGLFAPGTKVYHDPSMDRFWDYGQQLLYYVTGIDKDTAETISGWVFPHELVID